MNDRPIGLSTGCFYKTSIFDCLEQIQTAGFSLIEICSFPAHLDYHDCSAVQRASEMIDRLALEPFSFHAPFSDDIDITSPVENVREASIREIITAAEAASRLGVRYFVIHPGPEKGNLPEAERLRRMDNVVAALNQISSRCHELGVKLVLENMLPHLFFGRTREVLWILGALDTTEVGICLDTGHAYLSGDLETVVHKLSGHLWMVHASDNLGQYDDHLPPGEGEIDWGLFHAQLSQLHFSGTIILEIAGSSDSTTMLKQARKSRRLLRDLSYWPYKQ